MENTPQDILAAFEFDINNYFFFAGQIAYAMVLIIGTVVNIVPARLCMIDMIKLSGINLENNSSFNLILTIIIVGVG